ncbi:MAG: hypothetical protein IPJ19_18610 [Planctomycetes bacterium]|nr:hypothetical protein [Planctomycetota bacterium]
MDPVRAYLLQLGAAEHVVAGGLLGLVERWERIAQETAAGRVLDLDNWRNDLDTRQLLADALPHAPAPESARFHSRLAAADLELRRATQPLPACIWPAAVAKREGWQPRSNWWYFVRPTRLGPEFAAELEAWSERVEPDL